MRDRDPFEDIRRMQEEMSKMFGRMFGAAFSNLSNMNQGMRTPEADVWETDSDVVVHMEVPGASKEDIEINAVANGLEVRIENKQEQEENDEGYRSYRSAYSGYYRTVPLPDYADAEKAKASYENGILEITVPKKGGKKKKGKRIDVQ